MERPRFAIWVSRLLVILIVVPLACGPSDLSQAPRRGLLEEWIDPAGPGGANTLFLYENGAFQLRHCPRELCESDSPSEFVAQGQWERSEGIMVLSTDDWEAMFVAAIVPVQLLDRSDTLRGLQWMQSSSKTPVDTCRFVRRADFVNFVRPPEGSGTSGW
jgi:hypothetical protein